MPDSIGQDNIQKIANIVHHSNQQVRDEAANFILTVSSHFDDPDSLLPIQKFTTAQLEQAADSSTGTLVNFHQEPHKSKKQLSKLIKVITESVQTRAEYL